MLLIGRSVIFFFFFYDGASGLDRLYYTAPKSLLISSCECFSSYPTFFSPIT